MQLFANVYNNITTGESDADEPAACTLTPTVEGVELVQYKANKDLLAATFVAQVSCNGGFCPDQDPLCLLYTSDAADD